MTNEWQRGLRTGVGATHKEAGLLAELCRVAGGTDSRSELMLPLSKLIRTIVGVRSTGG